MLCSIRKATADVLIEVAEEDAALAARYNVADYRSWYISQLPRWRVGLCDGAHQADRSAARRSFRWARAPPSRPRLAPVGVYGTGGEYMFVVFNSPTLGDGRGANKPWLQELPDPVTKLAWQSWVEVHPSRPPRSWASRKASISR